MKKRWQLTGGLCLVVILIVSGLIGCNEPRGSIEGQVVNAEADPVAGVNVRAERNGYPGVLIQTDENGYYCFTDLPAGDWEIEFFMGNVLQSGKQNMTVTVKDGEIARLDYIFGLPQSVTDASGTGISIESWLVGEHFYYGQNCIWKNILVGLEFEYEKGERTKQYISTFDLGSREKKRVIEISGTRMAGTPSIYQNKIVWDSVDSDEFFRYAIKSVISPLPNYDIFLFDLETNEVKQLTTEKHAQMYPKICGDTVVWLDARNQPQEQYPLPFDIYIYDLKTGNESRITENTTVEGYSQADIDGNTIVWTDIRHADTDVASHAGNDSSYNNEIYAYDIHTHEERRLTTASGNDQFPDISGNTVTWLRQKDYQKADIFSYDMESGIETQISNSGYASFSPSIYGDKIVWTDARSSNGNTASDVVVNGKRSGADIYIYDLETKTEARITTTDEKKVWQYPVVYGDYIVYEWSRQIGSLVYIIKLL